MGEVIKTVTVYFEDTDREVDIDVDCEYEVRNDGIGAWECHGKGYDAGVDYAHIYSTEWDKTGFSPEEIEVVKAEIEKHIGEWEGEIDVGDYDDPPDREMD